MKYRLQQLIEDYPNTKIAHIYIDASGSIRDDKEETEIPINQAVQFVTENKLFATVTFFTNEIESSAEFNGALQSTEEIIDGIAKMKHWCGGTDLNGVYKDIQVKYRGQENALFFIISDFEAPCPSELQPISKNSMREEPNLCQKIFHMETKSCERWTSWQEDFYTEFYRRNGVFANVIPYKGGDIFAFMVYDAPTSMIDGLFKDIAVSESEGKVSDTDKVSITIIMNRTSHSGKYKSDFDIEFQCNGIGTKQKYPVIDNDVMDIMKLTMLYIKSLSNEASVKAEAIRKHNNRKGRKQQE